MVQVLGYDDSLYTTQHVWLSWIEIVVQAFCYPYRTTVKLFKKLCKKHGPAALPHSNDVLFTLQG